MHGVAALQRARKCELYMLNVEAARKPVSSLRLHWDGGHHGGLDVQVGLALAPSPHTSALLAAYLEPAVRSKL